MYRRATPIWLRRLLPIVALVLVIAGVPLLLGEVRAVSDAINNLLHGRRAMPAIISWSTEGDRSATTQSATLRLFPSAERLAPSCTIDPVGVRTCRL